MIEQMRGDVLARVQAALGGRPMPAVAIVIGIDDGTVLDVVTAVRPDVRVVVFEPDATAAGRVQPAGGAFGRLSRDGRLRLLIGPDYAGADDAWRVLADDPDDHVVLVSPTTATACREGALAAARVFGRMLFGARANAEARRRFAPGYLRNTLANLGAIARGTRADALDGWWAGRPAVVVGAGPSLDRTLPALATLASRAVVITTDTALRPLLHAGVSPEVVVGADPSASNGRHFENLPPCDDTWLVAESALDPRAAAAFPGRTAWFRVAAHDPWPWANGLGLDVPVVDMWGSVLTAAWQLALRAGCDPIVFVGADLAFTGGRPYARGTTYEFDWAYSATLGTRLDEAWRQQIAMHAGVTLPGLDGRPVPSSQPLQAFRDWLVTQAARSGRRVVNATGGGIFTGPAVVQGTLDDELRGRPVLPRATVPPGPIASMRFTHVADEIAALRAAIARGDRAHATLSAWAAFTGATLDLPALEAALRVAAEAVGPAGGAPASPARVHVPWPALAAAGFPMTRLSRLPEDVLEAPPAERLPADVVAQALVAGSAAASALATAVPEPPLAATPAGTSDLRQLVWPEAVAWPLRVLDALHPPAPIGGPSSYFDRPVTSVAEVATRVSPAIVLRARTTARLVRAMATQVPAAESARLHGMAAAIDAAPGRSSDDASSLPVSLALEVSGSGDYTSRVRLHVSRQAAARAMTGAIFAAGAAHAEAALAAWRRGDVAVSLACAGAVALVTPDVLTDRGLPRATAVYAHDDAAIVVPLHGTTSLRMAADGTMTPHATWPLPIVGELPMGDGAVAWSNGTAGWPAVGDGYVLYREQRDGEVVHEPLPCRPTAGAWFDGRLYWTLFRTGVGIWAPGQTPRHEFADDSFAGVTVARDGVWLAPLSRDADGRAVRRVHRRGWRLDAAGVAVRVDLGPDGGCVGGASGAGWTARAYPDVDRVRLAAGARAFDLVCHVPVALAWAGSTLVVCTAAGDVLRFHRLAEFLDRLA